MNDNNNVNESAGVGEDSDVGLTSESSPTINDEEVDDEVETVSSKPRLVDVEVVGLLSDTNGRACCSHQVCGEFLIVGDLVRLVYTTVTVHGKVEQAIKVVKIADGVPSCTVGFVPRVQTQLRSVVSHVGKLCLVHEIYSQSPNSYKREKSHKNRGMASLIYLDSIPHDE